MGKGRNRALRRARQVVSTVVLRRPLLNDPCKDVAKVSIEQARERLHNMRRRTFEAAFHELDCFEASWRQVLLLRIQLTLLRHRTMSMKRLTRGLDKAGSTLSACNFACTTLSKPRKRFDKCCQTWRND